MNEAVEQSRDRIKQKILVVEVTLNNPNGFHAYALPAMASTVETPVLLLSVQDMNGDGKPDLLITVEGTAYTIILYNNGTTFQPNLPQE